MSQDHTDTKIEHKPTNALARPGVRDLANRGLCELEATESAERWLDKAWEHQCRDSDAFHLSSDRMAYLNSDEHHTNMRAEFDCLQRAVQAKPDHFEALWKLSKAYLHGCEDRWVIEARKPSAEVTECREKTMRLLSSAAKIANPSELSTLVWIFMGEDSLLPWPEGMKEAERICRIAAEQGHPGAQHDLGYMYAQGKGGLPKNYELMKFWCAKAAESDDYYSADEDYLDDIWNKPSSKSTEAGTHAVATRELNERETKEGPKQTKRRILVVDDEVPVLLTMKAVLEISGFEVDTASSGREGVSILKCKEYDLVISDMRMEDHEAGARVISAARSSQHRPVTALLTAYPLVEEECRAMGINSLLLKPMHTRQLLEQIEQLLGSESRPLRTRM